MRNITLIGMSGCGKTTLGKIIAEKLGMQYVDGDDEIIKATGKQLPEIIDQDNPQGFLDVEEEVLSKLKGDKVVFAPGGSCIYSEKIMNNFNSQSIVVFMDVPYEIVYKRRLKAGMENIVMFGCKDFEELFNKRRPLYDKFALVKIELDDSPKEENAQKVIDLIKDKLTLD